MPIKKYIKKYGLGFCVAIVLVALEAAADLMMPTILASVIDKGIAAKDMNTVWRLGGLMFVITLIGAAAAMGRNVVASTVSQRLGTEMRSDLFRKIQHLTFESLDQFERASLMTRLTNDVTLVQHFLNGLMRIFVKAPLLGIGAMIMAVRLNPDLSVVLFVVVPIVAVLVIFQVKVGFARFMGVQQALDRVNGAIREYLAGVRVVKAFNRFDYEVKQFDSANDLHRQQATSAMRAMAIFNPLIMLVVNLGVAAVLWVGGLWVNQGDMPVGHIVAFVNYMMQILFALTALTMVFNMFVRAKASAQRIQEVFRQDHKMDWNELTTDQFRMSGDVIFKDVSFSYAGHSDSKVLQNISFRVQQGETLGIIGSTGSGKSSLVSLIPRFYDMDSGSITVGGVPIQSVHPSKLREHLAIVPQKTVLFSGTILDNIRWGNESASMEEVEQACRLAEAHGFITDLPEGYLTRLGQRGINLSGGQKQRLSIARALVKQPKLLILDDCTSAVDMAMEARIKASLKQVAKEMTCFIIAQRITSVMDADHILVLDKGEVAGLGTHEQLMKTCEVYRDIYHSQMGSGVQSYGS